MASFVFVWNATFESAPADGESESLGAGRIRDLKSAIHERLGVDHSWAGDASDGKHLRMQGPPTQSPTLVAGDGCLYYKTINGVTELFYKTGTSDVQMTSAGRASSSFPATTKMVFVQAVPPVGWSLDTAYVDRTLLISSGGAVQGGSWQLSGLTAAGHVLTVAELPSHTHPGAAGQNFLMNVGGGTYQGSGGATGVAQANTGATGSDQAHTHPVTSDQSWRPNFVTAIVCSKQ